MSNAVKISALITFFHCLIGNILAYYSVGIVLEVLFLPYTFIAGMSNFAGWGLLSLLLEGAAVIVIFIIVLGIVRSFKVLRSS